eukprot:381391-Prymnesium_polylepis.1
MAQPTQTSASVPRATLVSAGPRTGPSHGPSMRDHGSGPSGSPRGLRPSTITCHQVRASRCCHQAGQPDGARRHSYRPSAASWEDRPGRPLASSLSPPCRSLSHPRTHAHAPGSSRPSCASRRRCCPRHTWAAVVSSVVAAALSPLRSAAPVPSLPAASDPRDRGRANESTAGTRDHGVARCAPLAQSGSYSCLPPCTLSHGWRVRTCG